MEKKLGSLFDGIGGFPLAAKRNGIRPVWASEIEKFPMAVTVIYGAELLAIVRLIRSIRPACC